MFGGKLAEEVFNAKGSIGSLEAKGHGSFLDVRLLELRFMVTKKMVNLKPARGFKGAWLRKDEKSKQKKLENKCAS
jgi:hypothetical protein